MKRYLELIIIATTIIAASADEPVRSGAVFPEDVLPTPEGRITNGFPANPGDVPYIVSLNFQNGQSGWWCGGSIISNTWILTAAHCSDGASKVIIAYGATDRQNPQFRHDVSSNNFRQHPNYNKETLRNDVSLIRTPRVQFTSRVNRIELPRSSDRNNRYAGELARASGWGKTSDQSGISRSLNSVDLRLISNVDCARYYIASLVSDSTLCAETPDAKSTCQGDSGGPLVLRSNNRLVGVVSFVPTRGCTVGGPAGFARVTSYLDWIKQHTGVAY